MSISKALKLVMNKYPEFKSLNEESRDNVWNNMVLPIIRISLEENLNRKKLRKKKHDTRVQYMPPLAPGIVSLFPEMKDDKQSISAVAKKVSACFIRRRQDNEHHHPCFAHLYSKYTFVLKASKAPESCLNSQKAPEVIPPTPVAEKTEVVTQGIDSVPVSIISDGIINASGNLTYDDCINIINIIYKRR
jgi:hypothetical protein